MSKIKIKNCKGKKSLLELLREKQIYIESDCGGIGSCGKCRVRLLKNAPVPTAREKEVLGRKKLDRGWRLACQCYPKGDILVELSGQREELIDIPETPGLLKTYGDIPGLIPKQKQKDTAVCVDIGTTTIGAVWADVKSGKILGSASCINHQRAYGADVISRIHAANKGKDNKLRSSVQEDVDNLVRILCGDEKPDRIIISANTVMGHLLRGLSCRTLGTAPYKPVDISFNERGKRIMLPGISTFVGADIVSGICSLDMDQSEEIVALIDLGTNGEMVLGNRDKLLATSTAAGPAFEGVNISCGTAGIPGAISEITLEGGQIRDMRTIDGKAPCGICGSGVVEVTAELLKNDIIDNTGLMTEEFFETGYPLTEDIAFTPKDVRQVQMAKSAIRAGFETLMQAYGITVEQISKLYLAGGFGQRINVEKACAIGMLPPELKTRTEAVGNSSLSGAVRYAMDYEMKGRMIETAQNVEELLLADSQTFSDLYLKYMSF